jgi:sec-independent protein translocase protein TatA
MFPNLSPAEMLVIGGLAVLLFGKRLPEVGRSLGRSVVELKKGLRGVEDEIAQIKNEFRDVSTPMYNDSISSYNNTSHSHSYDSYSGDVYDRSDVTVPKFEPPTPAKSPPQVASTDSGGGEAANV